MKSALLGLLSMVLGVSVGVAAALYERGWPTGGDPQAMAHLARDPATVAPGSEGAEPLGPQTAQPRIQIDSTTFNFGQMPAYATGEHSFVIKNIGHADLEIDQAGAPSCSCTVAEISEKVIPPGGQTKITMTWDTKNLSGNYRQSAPFKSNDLQLSFFNLVVEGEVAASIRIEPPLVSFDSLKIDESASRTFKVLAFHTDALEITGFHFTNPELAEHFEAVITPLQADVLAEHEAKSGAQVQVNLKPGLSLGKFRQTIRLASPQAPEGEFEVAVNGEVTGDIQITGPGWNAYQQVLQIGKVGPQGDKRTLRLLVRGPHREETQFSIKRVTPANMRVTLGERIGEAVAIFPLEIDTVRSDKAVNFLGSLDGGFGEIVLETTHPDVPELTIRVSVAADAAE